MIFNFSIKQLIIYSFSYSVHSFVIPGIRDHEGSLKTNCKITINEKAALLRQPFTKNSLGSYFLGGLIPLCLAADSSRCCHFDFGIAFFLFCSSVASTASALINLLDIIF